MEAGGWKRARVSILYLLSSILVFCSTAHAEWFDPNWSFRREIDVNWEADQRGDDGEIASAEFYTGGHALPNADDLRIVTEDGRVCNARAIKIGPGDSLRVIFQLVKTQKRYFAYFGNPHPPALPAGVTTNIPIRFGLLCEMRGLPPRTPPGSLDLSNIADAWQRGTPDYGGIMIQQPFIGYNPATDADRTIGKFSGYLFAPVDGQYLIAGAARDRAAIYLDGKPFLFIPGLTNEIRFNNKAALTRGRHEFVVYTWCNINATLLLSVGWQTPGSPKVETIPRESFGLCAHGNVGALEELKKTLTADFNVEYKAECFEHDPSAPQQPERGNYSHRVRLVALVPKDAAQLGIDWDFGDGQTGSGPTAEHVYLTSGVYPVRLTYHLGTASDSQTNKIYVQRDNSKGDRPPTDEPQAHAAIIAKYETATMPIDWLPWAVILHSRSGQLAPMLSTATRLAVEPKHGDASVAYETLNQITREVNAGAKDSDIAALWEKVPRNSDMQPRATKSLTNVLLWETGDFAKAVDALAPYNNKSDSTLQRRYAQAILLTGKADEARKILESIPVEGQPERAAAVSGALARTVEFYIRSKEVEAGEDAWECWQNRYPADFLEGYSVLLRVRLMDLAGHGDAGAKVAEAFANAVPQSSYAPQLLDEARKLTGDPAKRDALKAILKQRYPEDPLSQ